MRKGTIISNLSIFLSLLLIFKAEAQGSLEEFRKSASVEKLFSDKVYNAPSDFHWSGDDFLWYVTMTRDGKRFYKVLPEEQKQELAFDHSRLAESLSSKLEKNISADNLPIQKLEFNEDQSAFTFRTDSHKFSVDLHNYQLTSMGKVEDDSRDRGYWDSWDDGDSNEPVPSPDGSLTAFIKNSNLYIRDTETGEEMPLSYDGSKGFYYSSNIKWSPDGKKIMAYKVRPGEEHKVHYVESSPDDQLQPKLHSVDYLKPGDRVDFKSPQLFKVETREHISIPTDLFDHQYYVWNFDWREDSESFTFEYNERGHQIYRILEVDAETGKINVLIEESSPTFIDYSGKRYRYDTKQGDEIIWASERDGWNHLYLFDGRTGKLKNQITTGNWPVREVIKVDEENRHIYFKASGIDKGQDPYFLHYFRIDFDGDNLVRYTKENANHHVSFSPNYQYYVDRYSRINMPPVAVLKRTSDQKQIMELQKADISDLLKTGWKAPEPFMALGRDGKTEIWGMIMRPTGFDPEKDYPVIEYIYAGPHSSFVPKDFNAYYFGMSALAELGFIVVKIDGMGTSNRSKAFHDIAWKNLKDSGFPDRILWMKAAAKKYPYMNLDKVGIHGRSAGGQSSSGALIFHNDFYDVAVSSSGCYDNRMDKIWWNEQWMGYPIGPQYAESSCIVNADQLEGNLLLIVGELDRNVDPSSTFQFADALIKAKKEFELVVIPGRGHSAGNGEYGTRKRKDFFVQHLMGVTPPSWDEVYTDPVQ